MSVTQHILLLITTKKQHVSHVLLQNTVRSCL